MHGIGWATLQKMMLDAPSIDMDGDKEENKVALNDENKEEILNNKWKYLLFGH